MSSSGRTNFRAANHFRGQKIGKVRYMSAKATEKKFDVKAYISYVRKI
jgi:hypothetical protein